MKDYYAILGVSSSAHDADIRRAFRRLVQQYHPDRNHDPAALTIMQEINEAYDVLGDPARRQAYDYQRANPVYYVPTEPEPPRHRDPAYRRKRPYTPPARPREDPLKETMRKANHYLRYVNWFGFVLAVVLMIDRSLPPRQIAEKVARFHVEIGPKRGVITYLVTTTGRMVMISSEVAQLAREGDTVIFEESPVFAVDEAIRIGEETDTNLATVYRNFFFLLLTVLICSGLGLFLNKGEEMRFNVSFVNCIALFFTLILLF